MKEIQCEICWSIVMEGEERCVVHTDDKMYLSCILCGAASERLGWWITNE